jgi:hypothetical protein
MPEILIETSYACMQQDTIEAIERLYHIPTQGAEVFLAISDKRPERHVGDLDMGFWHCTGGGAFYDKDLRGYEGTARAEAALAAMLLQQDTRWMELRQCVTIHCLTDAPEDIICYAFPGGVLMLPAFFTLFDQGEVVVINKDMDGLCETVKVFVEDGLSNHALLTLRGRIQSTLDQVWHRLGTYLQPNPKIDFAGDPPRLVSSKDT